MVLTNERGVTTTERIDFVLEQCYKCGIPFLMPSYHRKRLIAEPGTSFYCPNGHGQSYVGKTEAQKLKEELDRVKKENEREYEFLQNRFLDTLSEKNKLKKQLNRVHKGVCPCCNRTFQQLSLHMQKKHPELYYDKKSTANIPQKKRTNQTM